METLRQSEETKLDLKDRIFIEGIKEGVRVLDIIGPVKERTK
jgi:predicted RNA-binding protein